uniref:Uncharacterized protein n=1 Tax=Glossina austeni TaxID=7395 RepID=A0A1A9UG56_GLOAU
MQVQPLYDVYQREVELNLWEPINRYWAECYEACKIASKKRGTLQADNRALFQSKDSDIKVKKKEEYCTIGIYNLCNVMPHFYKEILVFSDWQHILEGRTSSVDLDEYVLNVKIK